MSSTKAFRPFVLLLTGRGAAYDLNLCSAA